MYRPDRPNPPISCYTPTVGQSVVVFGNNLNESISKFKGVDITPNQHGSKVAKSYS